MNNNFLQQMNTPFWGFVALPFFGIFMLALVVWALYWKGRALWMAARKGDLKWFIALLIINTAGILEILYIYIFSKKSLPASQPLETKEN